MSPPKMQSAGKLTMWCGIWGNKIVGPVYFDTKLNAEIYLNILQDTIVPTLLNEDEEFSAYFQQDGAPPHYVISVRRWLDQQLPGSWIGRRRPMEWPPRSPDHSSLYLYVWGHLKAMVYHEKLRNMNRLNELIRNAISRITPDVLTRVHHEWENRIRICFQSNGIFCEQSYILLKSVNFPYV
jgi:hypothetical protein